MLEKLTAFVEKRMHGRSFKNSDEVYLFLVLIAAVVFAGTVHVVLLFSFIVVDILPMVGVNALSIVIYLLALLLTLRRRYTVAGLMVSLEIACFAVVAQLLIGFYSYLIFFFFLVLILQLIVPYGTTQLRIAIVALMIVLLLFQVAFEPSYVEPYPLGEYHQAFSCFNIMLTFVATAVEFSIGTYIKSIIARNVDARTLELEAQANTDTLTRLFNRRYAHQYFKKISTDVPRLDWCVAMLDVDDFKAINDTYGHAVGDVVLSELAAQLTSSLRQSDVVFRWGGEEFLILLLARNVDIAYNVLDKIRDHIANAHEIEERVGLRFTVTLGVSRLDLDAVGQSIERCDEKLYAGKKSGKNQVVK